MAEKIYPSLLQIQSQLKAPKSQYNSFGKYKYRNAEDILQAAKPLNVKYNCVPVITSKISEINGASYVEVKIKLVQAEDGSSVEVTGFAKETDHKKGMDPAQVTGATFSYALKYALNGLYAIDDTKDVDTEEYQQRGRQQPQQSNGRQNSQYPKSQQRQYKQQGQRYASKPLQNKKLSPLEKKYSDLRKNLSKKLKKKKGVVEGIVLKQAMTVEDWNNMNKSARLQQMIDIMEIMMKKD